MNISGEGGETFDKVQGLFGAATAACCGCGKIAKQLERLQGFSHTGYLEHENSDGATYHGDATAWKTYTLHVKLPRGSPPGQWRVESLDIRDKAGNRKHHQFIELLVFSADGY